MRGLEPPRCPHHRLLRPARLPVPPHPHGTGCHYANGFRRCQPGRVGEGRGACITVSVTKSVVAMPSPVVTIIVPVAVVMASRANVITLRQHPVTSWTATVPASITCVVAINKLATLRAQALATTTTATLGQRINRHAQYQH